MKMILAAALVALPGIALAQAKPTNIADIIHPNIHQNNGTGNNANPGVGNDNGNNRHGIANNPGQSGVRPNDDGVNGFANQLEDTVHGGIDEVNPIAAAD